MKPTLPVAAALALTLVAGCVVTSVYPFYTAKDVVFDSALLGGWDDPTNTNADAETWTFEKMDAGSYKLIVKEKDKETEFAAHLFTLKGGLFLDLCPRKPAEDFVPPHYLLKVARRAPQLELAPLNYKWLEGLLAKHPRAIRHLVVENESDGSSNRRLVLTADTAELQKFVLRHADSAEAFKDATKLTRK